MVKSHGNTVCPAPQAVAWGILGGSLYSWRVSWTVGSSQWWPCCKATKHLKWCHWAWFFWQSRYTIHFYIVFFFYFNCCSSPGIVSSTPSIHWLVDVILPLPQLVQSQTPLASILHLTPLDLGYEVVWTGLLSTSFNSMTILCKIMAIVIPDRLQHVMILFQ